MVEFSGKIRNGQPVNGGSCGLSLIAHLILIKILFFLVSKSNFCYNLTVYVKKKNIFIFILVVEFSRKIRDGQPVHMGSCGLSLIAHLIFIKILFFGIKS